MKCFLGYSIFGQNSAFLDVRNAVTLSFGQRLKEFNNIIFEGPTFVRFSYDWRGYPIMNSSLYLSDEVKGIYANDGMAYSLHNFSAQEKIQHTILRMAKYKQNLIT